MTTPSYQAMGVPQVAAASRIQMEGAVMDMGDLLTEAPGYESHLSMGCEEERATYLEPGFSQSNN